MICRTPEEAYRAGREEPCEHGIQPMRTCPKCRLTPEEIADLVVLLRPYLPSAAHGSEAA